MIDRQKVIDIAKQWLDTKENYFLVDVTITPDNSIVVEIDQAEGVWIDDCVDLSRFIESALDRDVEDYELEVGSAGIGQPFKPQGIQNTEYRIQTQKILREGQLLIQRGDLLGSRLGVGTCDRFTLARHAVDGRDAVPWFLHT